MCGYGFIALVHKVDFAAFGFPAIEPTLMHQMMVVFTEQNEVLKIGFSAIGPVLDVMTDHEAMVRAARKATAAVSGHQGSSYRWRNRACFSPNRQRFARICFLNSDGRTVARHSPRCFRGNVGTVFYLCGFILHMQNDLIAIGPRTRFFAVIQIGLGNVRQCIGSFCAAGVSCASPPSR